MTRCGIAATNGHGSCNLEPPGGEFHLGGTIMSRTPTILFLTTLVVAAALLAGCGSSGVGDVLGGSRSGYSDVKGTVTSVDTRDRTIVVDQEGTGTYLRNSGSDELVLYYDDNTRVDYQ